MSQKLPNTRMRIGIREPEKWMRQQPSLSHHKKVQGRLAKDVKTKRFLGGNLSNLLYFISIF